MRRYTKHLLTRWTWVLTFVALVLFVANLLIFYPGFMSYDSLQQLRQAIGNTQYFDWHPPVMALIWGIGIHATGLVGATFTGQVASMLVFQLLLLWGALLILSWFVWWRTQSHILSLLPLGFGLLPFVINISGVIWKDTHMAFALLLAVSLTLALKYAGKRTTIAITVGIALCLIYASMLRYNALLAVLPIIYLARRQVTSSWKLIASGVVVIVVLATTLNIILSAALQVQKSHPTAAVMLDDIVGTLSPEQIRAATVPEVLKQNIHAIQAKCEADQVPFDSFHACATDPERHIVQYAYYDELDSLWKTTLVTMPGGYLKYRAQAFWIFLTTPKRYEYVEHDRIDANEMGLAVKHDSLARDLRSFVVDGMAKDLGILFRPYFWLILAACLFVYAWKWLAEYRTAVICLTLSAVLYILGYFPVVIGGDYRYIYWSVIATCLGLLLALTEKFKPKPKP